MPRSFIHKSVAAQTSYTPVQIAQRYGIPFGQYTGKGQKIGILEMGGGIVLADVLSYVKQYTNIVPSITIRNVNGGMNSPGSDADGEQCLDVEIIATIAPSAEIFMYNVTNSNQGFLDFFTAAEADGCNLLSGSWGDDESAYPGSWLTQIQDAAAAWVAKTQGIVCFASGDAGSSDGQSGQNCDFPASAPAILGCGSTSITADGDTVWNDGPNGGASGGGISGFFAAPSFQSGLYALRHYETGKRLLSDHGRGVPDVAADGDEDTGWIVNVNGQEGVFGGTSSDAPFWTAIFALALEARGKPLPSPIHPVLYGNSTHFGQIISGNNGFWRADPVGGWNACTGLGVPTAALFQALVNA